ncbi:hypothetical protein [Caudoviricetes sp.]|nr:hypothetical protein [Caudoviricetes sp.]
MVKLSRTSKLDGIMSWSLQAIDTCPGSKDKNGNLVAACQGCYATTGNYNFPNVKAPRIFNKVDWQREDWVNDMVKALDNERYFRWFDSGDVYHVKLAEKIYQIMRLTPHVKHWLPTRMLKFSKFSSIFDKMKALENVMIRFSSDSVMGEYEAGKHGSTILPDEHTPSGVFRCMAYASDGKCNGCRACYDKTIQVIGYPQHGVKMKRVINLKIAA